MVKLNSLVGKTIAKVEKSQKLDYGFIITFSAPKSHLFTMAMREIA